MQSVCITIKDSVTGDIWTPAYECHSGIALADIINGTMFVLNGNSVITSIEVS